MKPIHLFIYPLLFLAGSLLNAQQAKLEKEISTKRNFILENSEGAFECTLEYHDRSDVSFTLYTARGEMRNMANQESFPVVAFVSRSRITAYHFKDEDLAEDVLDFKGDYYNPVECEEVMNNKEGYVSKITFEEGNALWIEKGDTTNYITNTVNLDVYREEEYLWWGSKRISLRNYLPMRNFQIEAESENRVVLSYAFSSNPYNPMGRCGAGEERGLIKFEIDERGNIVSDESFPLESCYRDVYFSRETRNFGSMEYYYYEVEFPEKIKTYYFRPDKALISEVVDDILDN